MAGSNKVGIYIPSYGRAGEVSTLDIIGAGKIVVPEKQYKSYAKHYPKKSLFVVPNNRDGNVAKKRNAILDLTPEKYVAMFDDDLRSFYKISTREKLEGKQIHGLIRQGFMVAEELGARYFGFNWTTQPRQVFSGRPFSLNKVFWNVLCIIKTEIRFDENLKRCDDVDFWLKHVHRDKITLRFNYYHGDFRMKQKTQAGGISHKADPQHDIRILQKRYGKRLVPVVDGELGLVKSPYKGV